MPRKAKYGQDVAIAWTSNRLWRIRRKAAYKLECSALDRVKRHSEALRADNGVKQTNSGLDGRISKGQKGSEGEIEADASDAARLCKATDNPISYWLLR